MWWCIRDDKEHYIYATSNNRYEAGPKSRAGMWDEVKARNILKCLPNTIINKDNYYLEPFDNKTVIDEDANAIRTASYNVDSVIEIIRDIQGVFEKVRDYKEKRESLNNQLSMLEREQNDLLHIIELDNPKSARDGYLLYKSLRECRKKRREIKDLMVVLDTLEKSVFISETAENDMASISNSLQSRLYYFRALKRNEDDGEEG